MRELKRACPSCLERKKAKVQPTPKVLPRAMSQHTCPYQEDVHGSDRKCNCCNDCRNICAEEI